jgi:hypothetical protein
MTTERGVPVRQQRAGSLGVVALLLLGIVAAFLIYRPDRELPFHHLDFSEFLPILQSTESWWERIWGLIGHYARHGRANVLPYGLLSTKWELFGWWSPGWQWSRFVVMAGIAVLAFRLLRRLGAGTAPAVAGASVYLASPSAAEGWLRLTMGEPVATFMLLALCLAVMRARPLRETTGWTIAVALLTVGIVLTKEMLVAALVLPLTLLLLTNDEGRLQGPSWLRLRQRPARVIAVVAAGCLVPLLYIAVAAPEGSYASRYGSAGQPVRQTIMTWFGALLPLDPVYGLPRAVLISAAIAFVVLVVTGWWLLARRAVDRALVVSLLAIALLFPLLGAILYAPWPAYQHFYALPFLFGTAMLVAFAVTGLRLHAPRAGSAAAIAFWCMLVAATAAGAQWKAQSAAALQRLNHRLVTLIAADSSITGVLFATARVDSVAWRGPAGTLRRYADAIGVRWPPARDIPCPALEPDVGQIVVYRDGLCPSPPDIDPVVERFPRLSLRRLTMVPDSIQVGLRVGLRDR